MSDFEGIVGATAEQKALGALAATGSLPPVAPRALVRYIHEDADGTSPLRAFRTPFGRTPEVG